MEVNEEVISIDLTEDDLLYRIRRDNRVLYVDIGTPGIIPRLDRTESRAILKHLRVLPGWFASWRTFTVTGKIDSPLCQKNTFAPHSLPPEDVVQGKALYNLFDIQLLDRISDRVFEGLEGDRVVVAKIARFEHEVPYLMQELKAYEAFQAQGFKGMPTLYGYVFEEEETRVVGFAMEFLHGSHAILDDLEDCQGLLDTIHHCGYILGDLNRYNWIRTDHGMKVFDFEAVMLQTDTVVSPAEETAALPGRLVDESGAGWRRDP